MTGSVTSLKGICGQLALLLMVLLRTTSAQWSTNVHEPLVVCEHPSERYGLRSFIEPNGDIVTAWVDTRLSGSGTAIYGQRLNRDGVLLWEPEGRLLINQGTRAISSLQLNRFDTTRFMIAYSAGPDQSSRDSILTMGFDLDGTPAWPELTVLAHASADPPLGTPSDL